MRLGLARPRLTFANVGVVIAIILAMGGGQYVEAASTSLAKKVAKALKLSTAASKDATSAKTSAGQAAAAAATANSTANSALEKANALSAETEATKSAGDTAKAAADAAKAAADVAKAAADAAQGSATAAQADADALDASLATLNASVASLTDQLASFAAETNAKHDQQAAQIGNLFDQLNAQGNAIFDQLGAVHAELTAHAASIQTLTVQNGSQSAQIQNLQSQIGGLQNNLSAVASNLQNQINGLTGQLSNKQNRCAAGAVKGFARINLAALVDNGGYATLQGDVFNCAPSGAVQARWDAVNARLFVRFPSLNSVLAVASKSDSASPGSVERLADPSIFNEEVFVIDGIAKSGLVTVMAM